ncbi:MAG: hypothetical protein COA86_05265 [Kangiella sp.]|nr:MAG: hypothetical protein COA86_05265 [Kangiella sp.]
MTNIINKTSFNTKHNQANKDANMTIKKLVTLAFLTCLPFTINADAFQDMKNDAEADFDLEFGGCDAKVAKQKFQIEQLQIHLEDFRNGESDKQITINRLQNQLANQNNGVASQINDANRQAQLYSNALSEQKAMNNKLITQINVLKLQLANNRSTIQPLVTQTIQPMLDSSIDVVSTAEDALWKWSAKHLKGYLGQDYAYVCPKNGKISLVVGTDYYALRSSVCSAAVHAGLINAKSGGKVIFRIGGSKGSLTGSKRNEIQSKKHRDGSYRDREAHFTFPTQIK